MFGAVAVAVLKLNRHFILLVWTCGRGLGSPKPKRPTLNHCINLGKSRDVSRMPSSTDEVCFPKPSTVDPRMRDCNADAASFRALTFKQTVRAGLM